MDGGEPSAWTRSVEALRPLLVRRAAALLGGRHYGAGAPDPEDLAQMTLLRLHTSEIRQELEAQPPENVRRYAFRALQNQLIDACDRKKRELLSSDDDDDSSRELRSAQPGPEAALLASEEWGERRRQLLAALSSLEPQERRFLEMCMRENSAPRAQEMCGWPPGTAANACQRRNALIRRIQAAALDVGGARAGAAK